MRMGKVKMALVALMAVFAIGALSACGGSDDAGASFSMSSNDTVGVVRHWVVGDEDQPEGTYEIVATSGHGSITINDKDGYLLAADDYVGEQMGSEEFAESVEVQLAEGDEIAARNHNSSDFKIEAYVVG